ncbi:MAG: alanyl-tRNA editing protein [Candidatus Brockarchaeota archaeon]|nr:alanyl-tRNA editing protein [Candidatus Brockarchaeota archaeon]
MMDSYLRSCDSKVKLVNGEKVVLDRTVFHPLSGGVANDLGTIAHSGTEYNVVDVSEDRSTGDIVHALSTTPSFKEGDLVTVELDWERRYALMKLHTAAHVLSSIMYKKYGALITGGHVDPDMAKDDFSIEKSDRTIFEKAIEEVNEAASKAVEVKIYTMARDEALKIPGIVKLADKAPPEVRELRIVEIPGIDVQADGGPHVRNTSEIGKVALVRVENKGRNRKRVYYKIAE